MAEPQDPQTTTDAADLAAGKPPTSWAQVWQLPTLLLGLLLVSVGYWLALPGEPPPTHSQKLEEARQFVHARNYEKALETLNVLAEPDVYATLTEDQQIAYHLIRGDALRIGVDVENAPSPRNLRNIVKHYELAQQLAGDLDEKRLRYLSDTWLALGERDKAKALVEEAEPENPLTRLELRQRVLENQITEALARQEGVEPLVQELERFMSDNDADLTRPIRIWAVRSQARLLLAAGEAAAAADLLSRWLAKLDFAENGDLGELMVLLGEAHLALGNPQAAESWLERGRGQLSPTAAMRADALLGLAAIRFAEHSIVEAAEHYDSVVTEFPDHPRALEGIVGLAECKSRLNNYGDALELYDTAVRQVARRPPGNRHRELVTESLQRQSDLRFANGDFEVALQYLKLHRKAHPNQVPDELLVKLAITHEQRARQMLGLADGERATPADYQALDPARRTQVAIHFEQAAEAYYQHAQQVAEGRNATYGESLWRAAENFDMAGDHQRAIATLDEYIRTQPDDQRRLDVVFRLAQAYHATGQFDAAIELYRELVEDHPKSQAGYDALVPLAQAYLAKGSDSWDQAEQVLRSVVTDHEALRPESQAYHDALIALGRLHYRRGAEGDYERAIERLNEAVERYSDEEPMPAVQFQLADAYRKSVTQLNDKMSEPLAPSERAALAAERARRLTEAQQAFDQVIQHYEAIPEDERDELQELYLRNSYFYRADCAYDLGNFEGPDGAIALYDHAVQRYENDPAVLVALIQIVNSYAEMGRYDLARTANERAKWHLKRMPDEAFKDPNLPMSREKWQRWLDWTSELALTEQAAVE